MARQAIAEGAAPGHICRDTIAAVAWEETTYTRYRHGQADGYQYYISTIEQVCTFLVFFAGQYTEENDQEQYAEIPSVAGVDMMPGLGEGMIIQREWSVKMIIK